MTGTDHKKFTALDQASEKPKQTKQEESFFQNLKETIILILSALLIAFLFKTFLFQPFKVEMSSMSPTVLPSERIIVSKISYKIGEPQRGDIVTFYSPEEGTGGLLKGKKILIKRIVGTEGDKLTFSDGKLYVDDKIFAELYLPNKDSSSSFDSIIVPRDEVFVMGDNRSNSKDSRMFGSVEKSDLLGKAIFVYWPPGNMRILH